MTIIIVYDNAKMTREYSVKLAGLLEMYARSKNVVVHLYCKKPDTILSAFIADNVLFYTDISRISEHIAVADHVIFNSPVFEKWLRERTKGLPILISFLVFNWDFSNQLPDYSFVDKLIYFDNECKNIFPDRLKRKSVYLNVYPFLQGISMPEVLPYEYQVTYYHSDHDTDLALIRKMCACFNTIFSKRFCIVADNKINRLLKNEVNDNIRFIDRAKYPLIKTDLVIADGFVAKKFIHLGVPVIVIGIYGFGGNINTINFLHQLNSGCRGRLGGSYKEYLPADIIVHEINSFFLNEAGFKKNAQVVSQKLISGDDIQIMPDRIDNLHLSAGKALVKLEDDISIVRLSPKDDYFFLQRKNGQVLTRIDSKFEPFVQQLVKGISPGDFRSYDRKDAEILKDLLSGLEEIEAIYYNGKRADLFLADNITQ